eukprot:659335-Rhodomonas_salina.1
MEQPHLGLSGTAMRWAFRAAGCSRLGVEPCAAQSTKPWAWPLVGPRHASLTPVSSRPLCSDRLPAAGTRRPAQSPAPPPDVRLIRALPEQHPPASLRRGVAMRCQVVERDHSILCMQSSPAEAARRIALQQ